MAWDFSVETVSVLTDGLPQPPAPPVPGQTFPAALHRGERFGAVLFLRLWRNGNWDSDSAIAARAIAGWEEPGSCGGHDWINPYPRPADGWDGQPVRVLGTWRKETQADDDSLIQIAAVEGMTASCVTAIHCETHQGSFIYPVDSPLGAFVIVVEGDELPSLTPLDAEGNPLAPV